MYVRALGDLLPLTLSALHRVHYIATCPLYASIHPLLVFLAPTSISSNINRISLVPPSLQEEQQHRYSRDDPVLGLRLSVTSRGGMTLRLCSHGV